MEAERDDDSKKRHHALAAPERKMHTMRFRQPSALPGFGLALGYTLFYLGLVVLLPLAALVMQAAGLGPRGIWAVATEPRTIAALRISFGLAFAAALVDCAFGLLIAWVLTRYQFPGRKLIDAAVDLPFALPTAVAGIALATLYAPNEWIGALFAQLGIKVAFTPAGIFVALVFVALPFTVRTVQPLIVEIDRSLEEASATLGGTRWQTIRHVILPMLTPAMLTGFALAFARAVSEYGSVIFIAGNLPYVSEIAPVLIVIKLEEYNYPGATAIAVVMLALAFCILLAINLLQAWSRRRFGHV
jgi:sulfate/thiosulfate transport system permease protein